MCPNPRSFGECPCSQRASRYRSRRRRRRTVLDPRGRRHHQARRARARDHRTRPRSSSIAACSQVRLRRRSHDEAAAPGAHRLRTSARSAKRRPSSAPPSRCATATGSSRPTASRASPSGAATAPGLRQPDVRQRRGSGQGSADAGAPLGATGSTSSRSRRRSARRSRRPSGVAMAARISKKDDCRARLLRRGRDVDGRVPHRAELRGRLQGAVHLLLPQQRLGDLDAGRASRRRRESFAVKALAYGMPGVRVDGNDLLAVIAVTQDAVERARARRRADADRGDHLPSRRPLVVGRSVGLSRSRPSPRSGKRRIRSSACAATSRRASCWTQELHDRVRAGDHRRAHGRGQARRRARRPRRSRRCSTTSSPSCRRTCRSRRRSSCLPRAKRATATRRTTSRRDPAPPAANAEHDHAG